jgi:uncharacterized protein YbaR (Trm112 family)
MFVELVDLLRCPRPHEDTWLVAAAESTAGRHIVRGTVGCPVCEAEYPVRDGVVHFTPGPEGDGASAAPDGRQADDAEARAGEAMRLAALLDLTSSGGTVVLGGAWDGYADALLALVDVRVLLVDAPRVPALREEVSAIRAAGLPVAAASVRGVALDERTADAGRLRAAAAALRPRGRLVAPAAAPLPDGVTELARDARHWVAERDPAPSRLVPLGRAPR